MCFSKEVSLKTFLLGLAGSLLTISLNTSSDIIFGLFLIYISFVQFIEYLIWKNQTCNEYNKLLTKIEMLWVNAEPLILGLLILIINKKLTSYLKNIFILLVFLFFIMFLIYNKNINDNCTIKNENDHLEWKWKNKINSNLYYIIFIVLFFFFSYRGFPNKIYGEVVAFILLITYIASRIIYKNKDSGTIWCYYGALVPIFWYIVRVTGFF
jgi:hypothetical protein